MQYMPAVALNSRNIAFAAGLLGLFIVSFSLPFLLAGGIGDYLTPLHQSEDSVDQVFPEATVVSGPQSYLNVNAGELLDPPSDKDFLVGGWFKLRTAPRPGERMVFFSKIDEQTRSGYAVGLARDNDSMRPIVYWRDTQGRGGWRNFPEYAVPARTWFLLGLSFYGGRYLGLHMVTLAEDAKPQVKLIGGYDLGEGAYLKSTAPLLIGASGNSAFRGKIGPVAVFNARDLKQDLSSILDELSIAPRQVPSRFSEANVLFWSIDGKHDSGKHAFQIQFERDFQRKTP